MRSVFLVCTGLGLGVAAVSGCSQAEFSDSIWNPFNLELNFDISQPPVRVGIVHSREGLLAMETWLPVRQAPPYARLRSQLGRHLGCGIQIQELQPFQISAHLQSGRIQYALVPNGEYDGMTESGPIGEVVASAVPLVRRGLIVASANSAVENLGEIKGKRFAFGPREDVALTEATWEALEAAGVTRDDIPKELLPVVLNAEGRQYHINLRETAKEIVYGIGTEVGVIEESQYEAFPESGGTLLPLKLAKDNFRVLGETAVVAPETTLAGVLVASAHADPDITQRIVEFLMAAEVKNAAALRDVGLARFVKADAPDDDGAPTADSTARAD